jgi:DNA polymerase-3 subunit epsilon
VKSSLGYNDQTFIGKTMKRKQHRLEAIMVARQKLGLSPVYLDAETTGTGELDEIIEIAIIDHDGSVLADSFVRPIGKISPDAYAIHGITKELLNDAPTWVEVWPQVESALQGRVVGIYNAEFDTRMLQQSHRVSGLDWQPPYSDHFCIMKLYAQFYGEWNPSARDYRWQKLDAARWQTNLSIPNSHRAKDDTLLARALLHYMADQNA